MVKVSHKQGELSPIRCENESYNCRRSSMKVNLSYVSSLPDCSNNFVEKIIIENNTSDLLPQNISPVSRLKKKPTINIFNLTPANFTTATTNNWNDYLTVNKKLIHENSSDTLATNKKKEQRMNKSCKKLKNAIVSETKTILNEKNELTKKTSEVLEPTNFFNKNQHIYPSIKVYNKENDQILVSGNNNEKNLVQTIVFDEIDDNFFIKNIGTGNNIERKCIESTPKIPKLKKNHKSNTPNKSLRKSCKRFFTNNQKILITEEPNQNWKNYSKSIYYFNHEQTKDDSYVSEKFNSFNNITSPILSQRNRKAKILHHSKKKKVLKTVSVTDKIKDSFFIRKPFTCSSINKKKNQIGNLQNTLKNQEVDTTNLDNNINITKLDKTADQSSSEMDITSINVNMPIIQKSFQSLIGRSLHSENFSYLKKKRRISGSEENSKTIMHGQGSNTQLANNDYHINLKKNSSIGNNGISQDVNTSLNRINLINIKKKKENSQDKLEQQPYTITSVPSTLNTSAVQASIEVSNTQDPSQKYHNKLISIVKKNLTSKNQIDKSDNDLKNKLLFCSDSEIENVPLIERIKNNFKTLKTNHSKKSDTLQDENTGRLKNIKSKKKSTNKKISDETNSYENIKNILCSGSENNELSIIESTPVAASRSLLLKIYMKENIASTTKDTRKFVDCRNDELINLLETNPKKLRAASESSLDTVINSPEKSSENREKIIIDESLNGIIMTKSKESKNVKENSKDKKVCIKRKLYPLRDNSQVSISSIDLGLDDLSINNYQKNKISGDLVLKKKSKPLKPINKTDSPSSKQDSINNYRNKNEYLEKKGLPIKIKNISKKPRKLLSKKIVVRRKAKFLDNFTGNIVKNNVTQLRDHRNSINEFDLRKKKSCKLTSFNHQKIIIVVTGLSLKEKNLVKSVVKILGSAALEITVTPRTTHVISSGTRTINLLRGIIRGCWLLSMEWVLKSLDNKQWQEPSSYEMAHFSKAVKENRRDRQLFGKAYVPELFVTCGFIYIQNGTLPPASVLKELVKIAGGRITENPNQAEIEISTEGLKEIWILDSITTGELQPQDEYKRKL